jgi:hypothetical protein
LKKPSLKSDGAGAGIEPARLSARDFESRDKINIISVFGWFIPQKSSFL